MTSFFEREYNEVKEFFTDVEHQAVLMLKASIDAVVQDINAHGLDAVKATILAMGAAAAEAKTAGKSPSQIGQAALSVAETAAVAGAVDEAKVATDAAKAALSADTAHALATATVTATQ